MNYEEVFSVSHLMEAAKECCKGIRWKSSAQLFEISKARWVYSLHQALMDGTYKQRPFLEFPLCERGKCRTIQAIHISDRCVQKCLCKYYLKPLLQRRLIYDNAASIKNKGIDFSIRRIRKHLTYHYKKHGREGGILLVDYHDYFNSISHEILLAELAKLIPDEKLYNITKLFIESFKGDYGLGIGTEVAQICAIFYPNLIDHYVKEQLHIKGYGRYMDDSYLIHEDINYLKFCLTEIERLSATLNLTLNYKRTRICNFKSGFTFLQKRFYITESGKIVMQLAKRNIIKRRKILRSIYKANRNAEQSYQSWRGYALKYNSYTIVCKMDNLYNELFYF